MQQNSVPSTCHKSFLFMKSALSTTSKNLTVRYEPLTKSEISLYCDIDDYFTITSPGGCDCKVGVSRARNVEMCLHLS